MRRWSVCWTQRTLNMMPSEYTLNDYLSLQHEKFYNILKFHFQLSHSLFSLNKSQSLFPHSPPPHIYNPVYSAMFSQLMETAEPWFSSFEREVRKVSLIWRAAAHTALCSVSPAIIKGRCPSPTASPAHPRWQVCSIWLDFLYSSRSL